jgi:hypothetical protein
MAMFKPNLYAQSLSISAMAACIGAAATVPEPLLQALLPV